jgi:hypothetical protein
MIEPELQVLHSTYELAKLNEQDAQLFGQLVQALVEGFKY